MYSSLWINGRKYRKASPALAQKYTAVELRYDAHILVHYGRAFTHYSFHTYLLHHLAPMISTVSLLNELLSMPMTLRWYVLCFTILYLFTTESPTRFSFFLNKPWNCLGIAYRNFERYLFPAESSLTLSLLNKAIFLSFLIWVLTLLVLFWICVFAGLPWTFPSRCVQRFQILGLRYCRKRQPRHVEEPRDTQPVDNPTDRRISAQSNKSEKKFLLIR